MTEAMSKNEAHRIVDKMSEDATWDDLIEEIYVRQIIEKGLKDSARGLTNDVREVRAKFDLAE